MSTRTRQSIKVITARRLPISRHSVAILLAFGLVVCGGRRREETAAPAASPTAAVDTGQAVATIAGAAIPYKSFERYLTDNAGDETEMGEQQDAIKSRLLDQFLEEQLLLRAAEKLKISVSEAEIDSYMKEIGVTEGEAEVAAPEGKEVFREKIRQGLVLQKVKDEAVLSKVQVTAGEVEDYLKKQPELAHASRRLVLRQILVDDKSLADKLRATLAQDPSRFEALARESSIAPDRGQARMYNEEDLPVELRDPLFSLEAGQISPALELAQHYVLFQLVRKVEGSDQDLDEVRRRIRLEMFQKKGEQALDRFIADLRKDTEIRVNRPILQFNYVGEYHN
ncbi:MAG TPA: peptidyl-prolyl cis-trans isomerase [Candidatus Polarisedimenticolia bacterium]|nr:peptidyl-prolyl cis-trans isomerase [Candidatus Polarisedimenticolia bacterium]